MIKKEAPFSFFVVILISSIILNIINLGDILSQIMPIWIVVFYSYYLINFNTKNEFFIALLLGLIIDITSGNLLGQSSFALILSSYFLLFNKRLLLIANQTTVQVFVFLASTVYIVSILIIHIMIQGFDIYYYLLLTPITNAIVYPFISKLLRLWL